MAAIPIIDVSFRLHLDAFTQALYLSLQSIWIYVTYFRNMPVGYPTYILLDDVYIFFRLRYLIIYQKKIF
jgi:hypothetical protein